MEDYFDDQWACDMMHEIHERERAAILAKIHYLSEAEPLSLLEESELAEQVDTLYRQLRETY